MSERASRIYLIKVLEVRPNPNKERQRIVVIEENACDAEEFMPQVKYPYYSSSKFAFYLDCDKNTTIKAGDSITVRLEGTPQFKRWVLQAVIPAKSVPTAEPKESSLLNNTAYRPDPLPGTCLPDAPLSAPTTPSKPLASIPAATATSVSLPATPSAVHPTTGSLSPQLPSLSATAIFYSAMMEQEAKAALRDRKVAELTEEVVQVKREQATTNRLLREIRRLLRDFIVAEDSEKKDYDDEDPKTEEDTLGGN